LMLSIVCCVFDCFIVDEQSLSVQPFVKRKETKVSCAQEMPSISLLGAYDCATPAYKKRIIDCF
jgi:hypothetical protein